MSDDLTLVLESSTYRGSVAVFRGDGILSEQTLVEVSGGARGTRDEQLMPAVRECMGQAGIQPPDLARVIVGEGPGSFTSLRIGGSIAKGFCHALDIPLYTVSSLMLIALAAELGEGDRCLALIDAMRGEWYGQMYAADGGTIESSGPIRFYEAGEIEKLEAGGVIATGPGRARDIFPHASSVGTLLAQISASAPVDLDAWEPAYGRLAEAQARWEVQHGRPLAS